MSNQLGSVLSSELIFNQKTAGALELALICIFLTAEILSMQIKPFLYFASKSFHTLTQRYSMISNSLLRCLNSVSRWLSCFFLMPCTSRWCFTLSYYILCKSFCLASSLIFSRSLAFITLICFFKFFASGQCPWAERCCILVSRSRMALEQWMRTTAAVPF